MRVTNIIGADSLKKLYYIHVDSAYAYRSGEIYDNGVRPGFDLHFYSVWINTGTLPADNCVLKILPPEEITLYGVSPGQILTGTYFGYTMSGDTIVINLGTNNPTGWYGGGGYVDIYGNLPPSVPVGHILTCRSWLTTTTPEKQLANNNVQHSLIVRGSIDPNDKLCSPEGTGLEKKIAPDQRLSYMIRFENKPEATAEAIYIRVVDTLDHNLDWSTLAFGAMSHPDKCKYEFDPYAGVIDCFCDSIMLPPNVSKPEGEGYFTYSISPKKDLPAGTEVSNTAWIRFDYNAWLQAPEAGAVIRTIWQSFMCGDANGDRTVNIGDAVYVINYIFKGGPQPTPLKDAGDANCDHAVNVGDAVYVINYIFKGGPAPCCP